MAAQRPETAHKSHGAANSDCPILIRQVSFGFGPDKVTAYVADIYLEDIKDLKQQQEELWERLGEILDRLSMIR